MHSDAYRDINDSWERDAPGFIAEDEEAICGLQADREFWDSRGLSFGVEGSNGCLVAIGQVPSFNGITDYYWCVRWVVVCHYFVQQNTLIK